MKRILTYFAVLFVSASLARAGGPEYADFTVTSGTGGVSTEYARTGANSYKLQGDGSNNPGVNFSLTSITDWDSIVKVQYYTYTTAGWWGGRIAINSDASGWKEASLSCTQNTWILNEIDISLTPMYGGTWASCQFDGWNQTDAVYIDDIVFLNSRDEVLFKVDSIDGSAPPTSIELTPDSTTSITGKTIVLTTTPNAGASRDCDYTSFTPAVATVDATGVVTTLTAGTTKIKAVSQLAPSVSDSVLVFVTDPLISNSRVMNNFEVDTTLPGTWDGWVVTSVPGPTLDIVENPSKTGINTSDSVLKVDSCRQWGAVVFEAINPNDYTKIRFKAMATTDIADFGFEFGINGFSPVQTNSNAALTANTWVSFELPLPVFNLDLTNGEFFVKINSAGSAPEPGYTFYLDDVELIAGDAASFIPVTGVTITNATPVIDTYNDSLQMTVDIAPTNATNKTINWSVDSAEYATIDTSGMLKTATPFRGTHVVNVKITTEDGAFEDTMNVTISNQYIEVDSVVVTSPSDSIKINGGTMAMTATIYPALVSSPEVTWSVTNQTGSATIDQDGTLHASLNGDVLVTATVDGVEGTKTITLINQVPVESVTITNTDSTISVNNGTLQMTVEVLPDTAANPNVVWAITSDDADTAIISATGLVTAIRNGQVMVKATAADGSGHADSMIVILTNQIVEVTGVSITSEGNDTTITVKDGTLQLYAHITPEDASDTTVAWSSSNISIAAVDQNGLVTADSNGTVTITVTSVADASILATFDIVISGQEDVSVASNLAEDLRVYPNPTEGYINIANASTINRISVLNTIGQKVMMIENRAQNEIQINMSALNNGIYFLQIETTNGNITQKVIKN